MREDIPAGTVSGMSDIRRLLQMAASPSPDVSPTKVRGDPVQSKEQYHDRERYCRDFR